MEEVQEKVTSRVLTIDTLNRLDACWEQRTAFQKVFGDAVDVTVELAEQWAGKGIEVTSRWGVALVCFDLDWAVHELLSHEARTQWLIATNAARTLADETIQLVWKAYHQEYDRVCADVRHETSAWDVRVRAAEQKREVLITGANDTLLRATWSAWATAYLSETDDALDLNGHEEDE